MPIIAYLASKKDSNSTLPTILCYDIGMDQTEQAILDFNKQRDWDQFHSPENLAKSIAIEAGELLECFQWNDNFDQKAVCGELADVATYCILLADKLHVDLSQIILEKLKISAQKYPVAKSKGNSLKYTQL